MCPALFQAVKTAMPSNCLEFSPHCSGDWVQGCAKCTAPLDARGTLYHAACLALILLRLNPKRQTGSGCADRTKAWGNALPEKNILTVPEERNFD